MNFIADLHIHSRFSRATSKALTTSHLAAWAQCKGIDVVGTGDFTHPQWRAELSQHLTFDEASGFYALKSPQQGTAQPDILADILADGPPGGRDRARPGPLFCLQAEISSIYKRQGKVRKVHNLLFAPTLEDAERISQRLAQVGNLASDGRPILGLDSRDLLEIVLEASSRSVLIPAHIWTPWFSLFGSKSGFDCLEDCFGDLSEHIFALETGLSSDPAMNRLISALDGYALISNSDAHSGANLGREANLFAGLPSFDGMFGALRASAKRQAPAIQNALPCRFQGTLEFYPEEGKYHLDGHRACHVVLEPREALALDNICPVCAKPLTVGVLHRVLELADRDKPASPPHEPETRPLIPLPELLGEILSVGPSSRRVQERYSHVLRQLGPELDILCSLPLAEIRACWEPLGEAVARMREGRVYRQGGYDGEYGVVRVFAPDEKRELHMGPSLPGKAGARKSPKPGQPKFKAERATDWPSPLDAATLPLLFEGAAKAGASDAFGAFGQKDSCQNTLAQNTSPVQISANSVRFSPEQTAALRSGPAPALILAGPGAGKTRVLIGRLQWLLQNDADPQSLLAVTFTRRAAGELHERLSAALAPHGQAPLALQSALPACDTLHGLAWHFLRQREAHCVLLSEDAAFRLFCAANLAVSAKATRHLWQALSLARENCQALNGSDTNCEPSLRHAAALYQERKLVKVNGAVRTRLVDYADLLEWWLATALAEGPGRWQHVLVDEVQDLSVMQLALVRALLPQDGQGFFGIGDPDQAIYGFRGAKGQNEAALRGFWPGLEVFRLGQSFRASQDVLDMAQQLLQGRAQCGPLRAARQGRAQLQLFSAPDEKAEARWLAGRVQRLLGATSHSLLDAAPKACAHELDNVLSPGDIAVLVRLKAQIAPLQAALEQAGVPCTAPAREEFWQDAVCARLLSLLAPACGFAESTIFVPGEDGAEPLPWSPSGLPAPQAMRPWLELQPWAGPELAQSPAWRALCRLWGQCESWDVFFARLAWLHEAELIRARAEQVQILTLHASKGLEFQAVFLPGVEDGLLPLRRELLFAEQQSPPLAQKPDEHEEERRLLYVGLTRAAQALFVSHSAKRLLYGRSLSLAPSPFLPLIRAFCHQSALAPKVRVLREHLSLLPGQAKEKDGAKR